VSAGRCSTLDAWLACLYYVVEVRGIREPPKIVSELGRYGIPPFYFVLYLQQHLECSRAGRELECRARPSAREAYFRCRDAVRPERRRPPEGFPAPPPPF
jgi:hypothetical protein